MLLLVVTAVNPVKTTAKAIIPIITKPNTDRKLVHHSVQSLIVVQVKGYP